MSDTVTHGPPARPSPDASAGPPAWSPPPPRGAVDRAFAALASFTVRWRWAIIALWVVLVIVVPAVLPSLSSSEKSQSGSFLPAGTPSLRAADLAVPFQAKNTASTLLVAGRSARPLSSGDQAAIDRAETAVAHSGDVLDVRDQAVSRDGHARRALVELRDSAKAFGGNADQLFNGLRSRLASVRPPSGLGVHFAGQLASASDQAKQAGQAHTRAHQPALHRVHHRPTARRLSRPARATRHPGAGRPGADRGRSADS